MCSPIFAVVAAVGQAAAGYMSASQQADQQNQAYSENARAAQEAARNSYVNLQTRQLQEHAAADQKASENSIAGLEKRSSARVAAGEGGVSGLSVDALIGNLFQQEGRNWLAIDTNQDMNDQSIRTQMDDVRANTQGRINSVRRAESPSPLPFIFQGLSGAVSGYSQFARGAQSGSGAI